MLAAAAGRSDIAIHHVAYEVLHPLGPLFGHNVSNQVLDFAIGHRIPVEVFRGSVGPSPATDPVDEAVAV
jgi:hypothetical protein